MSTVKPSAVGTGVPNTGVRAEANAPLETVADPSLKPARVAPTVIVELAPALSPVTVKGNVDPVFDPAVIDPAETLWVHVHEGS